jgi:hypothetical protein
VVLQIAAGRLLSTPFERRAVGTAERDGEHVPNREHRGRGVQVVPGGGRAPICWSRPKMSGCDHSSNVVSYARQTRSRYGLSVA